MLLSDVFETLTHGELANLKIGGLEEHGIAPSDYPRLVTNVNMGLKELYKRFDLKTNTLTLQMYADTGVYRLHSDFAESNTGSAEPIKYILDTNDLEPFNDNILLLTDIKIESETVAGEYDVLPLNDLSDPDSLVTPSAAVLKIPVEHEDGTKQIFINYRCNPDKIDPLGLIDPSTVEVPLPDQFMEALTAYVAYRLFASTPTGENNNDALTYYGKFEAAVALINVLGVVQTDNYTNTRLDENDWV